MTAIVTSDWGSPQAEVLRRTYWETFTRHKLLACLPIIIALLVAVAYLSMLQTSYVATASMWVDTPIPSGSSILGNSSPSGSAATVLRQMLQSSSFQVAAASAAMPASTRDDLTKAQLASAGLSLAERVSVFIAGPQLIGIGVNAPTPSMARIEARAVAEQYTMFFATSLTRRNQQQAEFLKVVVENAGNAFNQAVTQLAEYQRTHPGSAANAADPTVARLTGNVAQARDQYSLVRQQLIQAEVLAGQAVADAISSSDATGVPKLLDEPAGVVRSSRRKAYVLGLAGSLLGGGTVSALVLALLMATDKSVRKESDLEDLLDLEVVGTINDLHSPRSPRQASKRPASVV